MPIANVQDAREHGSRLNAVDLFSGIGGFNIAARQQEIETIFACDTDKAASECYEANLGLTPLGDIKECKEKKLVPSHDILMAGLPCQPFSIIGKGDGLKDARGMLVNQVADIADLLKPRAIILENVKRLSTHRNGKTMQKVASLFEEKGYVIYHRVLNALDFGLPQHRERIFIVALLPHYTNFHWPTKKIGHGPLTDILEQNVPERYFVKPRIQANRRAKHTSAIVPPAIWHQNMSDNVTSKPFSPALRASASYNYLLVNGERRLTEREMLRLQGFPEWFEPTGSYQQTRKQTGNAVPIPVVRAVLHAVKRAITHAALDGIGIAQSLDGAGEIRCAAD